ncbi:uncharacterized protein LOC143151820 [Ptiloglossa arizonensis]|uniref:uncharacterized protein LOC143151820 n=1 Tax=Ptiloglossa arizonensis TaxID=3350558 RepID=UPI003F9FBB51
MGRRTSVWQYTRDHWVKNVLDIWNIRTMGRRTFVWQYTRNHWVKNVLDVWNDDGSKNFCLAVHERPLGQKCPGCMEYIFVASQCNEKTEKFVYPKYIYTFLYHVPMTGKVTSLNYLGY